jgi:hypothetical protein
VRLGLVPRFSRSENFTYRWAYAGCSGRSDCELIYCKTQIGDPRFARMSIPRNWQHLYHVFGMGSQMIIQLLL